MTFTASEFSNTDERESSHLLTENLLRRLNRVITGYVFFNFIFICIAFVELILFLSFFASIGESQVLAFTLAIFFLTLFSYFVLRLYFQTKKPEEVQAILESFLNKYKESIRYQEGVVDHHLNLATTATRFASLLEDREHTYYTPPTFLNSFRSTLKKFSAFCHTKDFHQMKEFLLTYSIHEHIKGVKCEPTNLSVHAALASAYVTLSRLYQEPSPSSPDELPVLKRNFSKEMQSRFKMVSEKAIEEFKILKDFAPNDPWVHMQLAYSYHDLGMFEEEIQEYETILRLRPDDKETLFKLGVLYFQQGRNALGLRAYKKLKEENYRKADSLLKFYGNFTSFL